MPSRYQRIAPAGLSVATRTQINPRIHRLTKLQNNLTRRNENPITPLDRYHQEVSEKCILPSASDGKVLKINFEVVCVGVARSMTLR